MLSTCARSPAATFVRSHISAQDKLSWGILHIHIADLDSTDEKTDPVPRDVYRGNALNQRLHTLGISFRLTPTHSVFPAGHCPFRTRSATTRVVTPHCTIVICIIHRIRLSTRPDLTTIFFFIKEASSWSANMLQKPSQVIARSASPFSPSMCQCLCWLSTSTTASRQSGRRQ